MSNLSQQPPQASTLSWCQELTIQGRGVLSQPQVWPSSLMAVAIQPGSKLGPIGHVISFMANWPPWVFYGLHAIPPSNGHFMASGHILPSLAILASSHFTNPQPFMFDFGPGGVILSSRGLQAP
ncbi:hypothetical protein O181_104191 [Austropuccinia psidii MF-1]|uniref:Uncharacterized protein n=1 Tax=Austropuccinia psidii MF-1 TaxID=1389203 RepID=A0A9Q3JM48_9BASI|nr:hypothetical protein [Austropuccinia psidii MF-1]